MWQPTKDGADGKNFPKPLPRPGQPEPDDKDADGKTFGVKGKTTADIDAFFASIREGGDDVSHSSSKKSSPRPQKGRNKSARVRSKDATSPRASADGVEVTTPKPVAPASRRRRSNTNGP